MATLLLTIIYLAFISLGLPDSILGTALPAILEEWNIPLSTGGLVSLIVTGGTIISSFLSGHVLRKLGTGRVTALSCLMTGASLLGFFLAPSFLWLLFLALPLGLGGGTVDTALNNYVALNYEARHMNWLHSFWGVGATLSPILMSAALAATGTWRTGYRNIAVIQLSLAVLLILTLPLWRRNGGHDGKTEEEKGASPEEKGSDKPHRLSGAGAAFLTMFLYCSLELGTGLWGSSFLVGIRGLGKESAALFISLYYGGITAGRFFSGFLSLRFSNRRMIRVGLSTAAAGILLLFIPTPIGAGGGFILLGLGLAPIFPAMLHETPARFGHENSQYLIGYQMGFAYAGSTMMPPLFGLILERTSLALFPVLLTAALMGIIITSEVLNRKTGMERTVRS